MGGLSTHTLHRFVSRAVAPEYHVYASKCLLRVLVGIREIFGRETVDSPPLQSEEPQLHLADAVSHSGHLDRISTRVLERHRKMRVALAGVDNVAHKVSTFLSVLDGALAQAQAQVHSVVLEVAIVRLFSLVRAGGLEWLGARLCCSNLEETSVRANIHRLSGA